MKHIIHIFGASGSGTSTLGRCLSNQPGFRWMDSDDYFWMPTEPRYTVKRDPAERVRLMQADLEAAEHAVVSGSLADWGNALIPCFTLAIRLVTGTEERIRRIREREYEKFGSRILPGGDMHDRHEAFLRWAAAYDDGDLSMRSSRSHDEWQKKLPCRLLTLNGAAPLEENLSIILKAIRESELCETW